MVTITFVVRHTSRLKTRKRDATLTGDGSPNVDFGFYPPQLFHFHTWTTENVWYMCRELGLDFLGKFPFTHPLPWKGFSVWDAFSLWEILWGRAWTTAQEAGYEAKWCCSWEWQIMSSLSAHGDITLVCVINISYSIFGRIHSVDKQMESSILVVLPRSELCIPYMTRLQTFRAENSRILPMRLTTQQNATFLYFATENKNCQEDRLITLSLLHL